MELKTKNIPTVIIVFGATGDLMAKKIVPSLFHLYKGGRLPKLLHIIGFSRRDIDEKGFTDLVLSFLKNHEEINSKDKDVEKFFSLFSYRKGDFGELKSYRQLSEVLGRVDNKWNACSNKLFYLAVPPQYYGPIFENLSASGLTIPCSPEEGWTRVLVEKPFGNDLSTSENLDILLGKLFKEEQVYRIDHYLAKEMLQNILSFRFSNTLFEQSWNNKYIEKIEIRLLEKNGVEKRGIFYDGLGALRDVGQNHLLQMLALITMDNPVVFDSENVRQKRAEVLESLEPLTSDLIKKETFRAQHEGYRKIEHVKPNSITETYFKVKARLNSARWQGVPIILESGKKMPEQIKEIIVTFRHRTPCMCPKGKHFSNKIVFQLEPEEKIQIFLTAKKPGLEMEIEMKVFDFVYRQKAGRGQYVEEYEKLLLDAIEGNQLLFASTKEIRSMWRYIDPVIGSWDDNKVPLHFYKPDSDKILKESEGYVQIQDVFREKNNIAVYGLGKMGHGVAGSLLEKGWTVIGYNRTVNVTRGMEKEGLVGAYSHSELASKLTSPKIIWLMVPAGEAVDNVIFGRDGFVKYLKKGDIVIDAGNSYYKDSIARHEKLAKQGIIFCDVGFSGGPSGARFGASIMVGGDKKTYEYLLSLFLDLAVPGGVNFFKGAGAGHFVKMIHNGIEYGMMQAIAEGFTVLKKSSYKLNLVNAADIYNHGSVIESRLTAWLEDALKIYGEDLGIVSGKVASTGEGEWTVKTAKKLGIKTRVIEEALKFRKFSEKNPSYTGKILSALRNRFGGHKI